MKFIKYHGLGNDFVIIDDPAFPAAALTPALAIAVCRRGHGVGADGLMCWGAAKDPMNHGAMVLLNSDGSTPEMCGNGIRCLVKYAVDVVGETANPLRVETLGGMKACAWTAGADGKVATVTVAMGPASFVPAQVPMAAEITSPEAIGVAVSARILGRSQVFDATGVNTGNPHMVIFGDSDPALAQSWGPVLTGHPLWPQGTNVEFASLGAGGAIDLTVYERGCGLTQACGTGATATAAAAVRQGYRSAGVPIPVNLPGGQLQITVAADFQECTMEGPATELYRGTLSA